MSDAPAHTATSPPASTSTVDDQLQPPSRPPTSLASFVVPLPLALPVPFALPPTPAPESDDEGLVQSTHVRASEPRTGPRSSQNVGSGVYAPRSGSSAGSATASSASSSSSAGSYTGSSLGLSFGSPSTAPSSFGCPFQGESASLASPLVASSTHSIPCPSRGAPRRTDSLGLDIPKPFETSPSTKPLIGDTPPLIFAADWLPLEFDEDFDARVGARLPRARPSPSPQLQHIRSFEPSETMLCPDYGLSAL